MNLFFLVNTNEISPDFSLIQCSVNSPTSSANYFFSVVCESWQSKRPVICLAAVAYEEKSMTITRAMFWVLKVDVITNFKSPSDYLKLLPYLLSDHLGPVKRASKIMGIVFKVI